MKSARLITVAALTLGVIAAALFWSGRTPGGFATPERCVRAFYDAAFERDEGKAAGCLDASIAGRAPQLIRDRDNLKNFVEQGDAAVDGPRAYLDVDEVRPDATWRVRFHLEKGDAGWRIVTMDLPKEVETLVPYGTPVDTAPSEGARE